MNQTINTVQYLFSLRGFFSMMDILIVIILFFYIIFAFLLTRQVRLLNKSFVSPMAGILAQAAFAHFVLSIGVTLVALTSL